MVKYGNTILIENVYFVSMRSHLTAFAFFMCQCVPAKRDEEETVSAGVDS